MNCYDPESPEVCAQGYRPNEYSTDCQDCNTGFYCDQGLMQECPPGTYCHRRGMSAPRQCPPGQFCVGGNHRQPCPEKKYSEEGWPECESCVQAACTQGVCGLTPSV